MSCTPQGGGRVERTTAGPSSRGTRERTSALVSGPEVRGRWSRSFFRHHLTDNSATSRLASTPASSALHPASPGPLLLPRPRKRRPHPTPPCPHLVHLKQAERGESRRTWRVPAWGPAARQESTGVGAALPGPPGPQGFSAPTFRLLQRILLKSSVGGSVPQFEHTSFT